MTRQPQSVPVEHANIREHLRMLARELNLHKALVEFRGAMVKKSADQTTADYTGFPNITWASEVYDIGGWFDVAASTTRLTVPADVRFVQVGGAVVINLTTADTHKTLYPLKNGAVFDGIAQQASEIGATSALLSFSTGPIAVVAGDYFEMGLGEESDASVTIVAAQTNFWIRALA